MAIADRVTDDFQKIKSRAHNMYTDHTGRGASVKTRPGRVYWFVWPNVHQASLYLAATAENPAERPFWALMILKKLFSRVVHNHVHVVTTTSRQHATSPRLLVAEPQFQCLVAANCNCCASEQFLQDF